jgi:hypothetical protein
MSLFGRDPAKMRHLRGLCRAFGYLSATALVFGAWSVKSARAEMKQQTLTLGRQMMELARASNHDVTPISFNGQKMYLASSVTEDSATNVLDRYEAHCKAKPGQPAAGWKNLEKQAGKKIEDAPGLVTTGLMRAGDDAEGSVVCFVEGASTKATAAEAFKSFAETGELGYLGKLRYAYAKRDPRTGRTLILTAWTEEKFNLVEMMPEDGKDAPGEDFPELPRVPSSRRALSAHAEGMPYGVNVYKTKEAPSKVLSFYDGEMVRRGFTGFDPEMDERAEGGMGRTYVKDGVVLTVATTAQPEGNFVVLGLAGVSPDENGSPRVPRLTRSPSSVEDAPAR